LSRSADFRNPKPQALNPTLLRTTASGGCGHLKWRPPKFDNGAPITGFRVEARDLHDGGISVINTGGAVTEADLSPLGLEKSWEVIRPRTLNLEP
jgi:hypothetical protein